MLQCVLHLRDFVHGARVQAAHHEHQTSAVQWRNQIKGAPVTHLQELL